MGRSETRFCESGVIYVVGLVLLFAVVSPVLAQTADEVEQRIAALPADQRAYERFRYWVTTVPPEQSSGDPLVSYREYLLGRNFSAADADAEIKIVETQSARLEVERWNRILTAENPTFNTGPNDFLVEMTRGRTAGTALDVGMGQGRNAIWLAQQGWDVTGFDPAEDAVALAEETARAVGVRLKTEVTGMEDFDFGESRWDLIVLTYVAGREMTAALERALKPGGVLVIEAFHRDATRGRSIGGGVVFDTGELVNLYSGLRVVRYEEPIVVPDFGGPAEIRVVRYCGERPK